MTSRTAPRSARKKRIRMRVIGTKDRPRLTVYRSLKQLTVQIIDDTAGRTIVAASTKHTASGVNLAAATKLGVLLAEKAKGAGILSVVFDRNGYKYHGRIAALAAAAREGGLQF